MSRELSLAALLLVLIGGATLTQAGPGTGMQPVPARLARRLRSPAAPAPKVIIEGTIESVTLSPEDFPRFQGRMVVAPRDGGDPVVFRVFEYSLILVRDRGRLYAGKLKQLEPGWKVSAVYLVDDQGDLGGDGEWFMDNCIADYPRDPDARETAGGLPELGGSRSPDGEVVPFTDGVVSGTLRSVSPAPGELPDFQGRLVVEPDEGEPLVFRVRTYSLILVDDGGRLYAGRLDQLRPGWRIEAGYDMDNETGLGGNGEFHMMNCIVRYPGPVGDRPSTR